MPLKISFSMTWLSWLSHFVIFQIAKKKRIDKLPNIMCLVCLFFFFFILLNQSKNNAVLEPRTEHFRGLVGLQAKAKDLSFEAKAKNFKMCPRRLHLCYL